MTRERKWFLVALCIGAAAIAVGRVHMLPTELRGVRGAGSGGSIEQLREAYRFEGDDGRHYVYLGGFDGYAWARAARKLLASGSLCDDVADGVCRDWSSTVRKSRPVRYPRSIQVYSTAWLHRLVSWLSPNRPLLYTAFLLPLVVSVLSVVPAFAIGYRLCGLLGGWMTALLSTLNPLLLYRTIGGDNDAWNVFFPTLLVWLSVESILAPTRTRAIVHAVLAGALIGPYSASWNGWPFAWAISVVGLLANPVLLSAAAWAGDRQASSAGAALLPVVAFVVVAGVSTSVAGASPSYLDALPLLFDHRLLVSPAIAAASDTLSWPDVYASVGELRSMTLGDVAGWMGGQPYLMVGWLGVVLMLLPRRDWRTFHYAIFLAGVVSYRLLLLASDQSRWFIALVLASTLVAAVVSYAADPREGARRRAAIAIAVWFLAALFLGLGAIRHLLLLALPLAVAVAVAADRLRGWVVGLAAAAAPAARGSMSIAATVLICAALYVPLRPAWAIARDYLPQVHDAWYQVLIGIRDTSPADAGVSVWWDRGYLASYFSERPVTVDGGLLDSPRAYWLARALMAPSERESAGILRWLHCGVAPAPGLDGNDPDHWRRLGSDGRSLSAMGTVNQLVRSDEAEARELLRRLGLDWGAITDLVDVSHCRPDESFLVLSDRMARSPSWQWMATWDFARAFAASAIAGQSAESIAAELQSSYGLAPQAAADLVAAAQAARGAGRLQWFGSAMAGVPSTAWVSCDGSGAARTCPVRARGVNGLELRLDDPGASRLAGPVDWGPPAFARIAAADAVEEKVADANGGWAVLFDPSTNRAAIGSPAYIRSTYVQLMLLDGRYGRLFGQAFAEQALGERVVAWRIDWQALDVGAADSEE